jgi:putative glutamine amidotransferase
MSKNTITPRILVMEGCMGDTADLVNAAGGEAEEIFCWDDSALDDHMDAGNVHGLVLTGGSDIDPRLYGEKPHKEVYGVDSHRDRAEYWALDHAARLGIPVLGICRGSQIMCAYRGGSLRQHIEGHRGGEHMVAAAPGARTIRRAMGGAQMRVVSLHHQCVRKAGRGMQIAAYALDGTPEAIESEDGLWLGVQFHPEITGWENGNAFSIFQWLVRSAAAHAGGRADVPTFRVAKRQRATMRELARQAQAKQWASWREEDAKAHPSPPKKRRKAGELTAPKARHRYFCDFCGIEFDHAEDRNDHERYVCLQAPSPPWAPDEIAEEDWIDEVPGMHVWDELAKAYVPLTDRQTTDVERIAAIVARAEKG